MLHSISIVSNDIERKATDASEECREAENAGRRCIALNHAWKGDEGRQHNMYGN